ncbi:serine/threonine-protein kinase [Streptomyces thermoalcalitolerans]|uniref:non-specific serine/threonine protein kinase n=1 Tax=Streptomyces thermoalcalitolerans TaxID=65605 RepID=A0ABN1P0R8_9ACTN
MAGPRIYPLSSDDPVQLGPYRLFGRLASGGMGRIYLARSGEGGQLVAVKTLLAEGVVSDADRRRFAREVTLAKRIDSAYTATVQDADPDAELPWMAIDYIAAPSLAELVRTAGHIPSSTARWIAAETAQALILLHSAGIVHRDLKPQNILLPLSGPRLIDFGISHATDITRTSLTLGTIAFTSPEQARGEPSTTASDVYSLGATVFYLVTGRPPYPEGEDTLALLARVSRGELDLTGLPKELAPLVRPCLAVDPADRPGTDEVLRECTRTQAELPSRADGSRFLPPRWTELIEAYARHGHALAEGGPAPEAPTVDQRTRAVPPPGPTRQYTRDVHIPERERRRKHEEQERGEAEPTEREEARRAQQERQRDTGAAAAIGQGVRSRASGAASAGGRTTGTAEPGLTAPTPPSGRGNGTDFWKGIAWVVAVLALFHVLPTILDSSNSSSGRSSPTYFPTPTPPRTLEPEDLAFAAVRAGDCLNTYSNGYGGWSSSVPERVHCDSADAYLRVTATKKTGTSDPDCPSGNGRGEWTHITATSTAITLCLTRQYRKGQCFPAKIDNDSVSADLMVVWSCSRDTVPQGYNQILQITGYFKAPRSLSGDICPSEPGHYFYYWLVDNKENLICAEIA